MNCYICGKQIKKPIQLYDRLIICKKCFKQNNGFKCKECDFNYLGKDLYQNKTCSFCHQSIQKQHNQKKIYAHNYFFKPYPTFFSINDQAKLFFGIQLEIGKTTFENVNEFSVNNQDDFFYIKTDSTIPKYGCQIVTYPATLQYHQNNEKWVCILQNAKKYNFKSYDVDNCGLHIHINKSFFQNQHIAMIDYFVNNNKQYMQKLSKRQSKYSRFIRKPLFLYGHPINKNRYCALNLLNQNTIQFRMFRGTLKYKSIMSYIEFVYSISMYVKQFNSINDFIQKYSLLDFTQFYKSLSQLKYLDEFISELNKFHYKKGKIK